MPRVSGLEALKQIREDETLRDSESDCRYGKRVSGVQEEGHRGRLRRFSGQAVSGRGADGQAEKAPSHRVRHKPGATRDDTTPGDN